METGINNIDAKQETQGAADEWVLSSSEPAAGAPQGRTSLQKGWMSGFPPWSRKKGEWEHL